MNEDLNFEYGDGTSLYGGCGGTLQNIFWYFGGFADKRMVKLRKYVSDIKVEFRYLNST